MRTVTNLFNLVAIGLALTLLVIIVVHTNLVAATEDTIERPSRYDIAWLGAGGRLEALSLQKALASYMVTRDPGDAREVELFLDIVANRFKLYQAPNFQTFLNLNPRHRQLVETAEREFAEIRSALGSVEELDAPTLETWRQRLEKVFLAVDRVGADAHTVSVNEAASTREDLIAKQNFQKWLATGLVSVIALLLIITALQNRFLRAANATATSSARDFSYLAHHDSLTGLPNRMAFTCAFEKAVSECEGSGNRGIAVLAIDLDGFKDVNDRHGHATGDLLLKQVAGRMSKTCENFANTILAARIGGDEFVVMLDVSAGDELLLEQANILSRAISQTYIINGVSLIIGASIGVAASTAGRSAKDLLIDSDMALSEAKAVGKSQVLLFDPSMRDVYLRRALLETELAKSIQKGQVAPHYQIKMDVGSGQVIGVEALARWTHPELGFVSPAEFIPIAEGADLIVDLGRAILERACRDGLQFPDDVAVAVNLSVSQFIRDDILKTVSEVLEATGFPPERLILEVTESLMISEADRAVEILREFKKMGISVALDDFGTGYSALSYLRRFEWDELKIDRSFVVEIETDDRAFGVVTSITEMARKLGIHVTAEGAETPGQIEALRKAGCRTIQGFYFGRPVPASGIPVAILKGVTAAAELNRAGEAADVPHAGQEPGSLKKA